VPPLPPSPPPPVLKGGIRLCNLLWQFNWGLQAWYLQGRGDVLQAEHRVAFTVYIGGCALKENGSKQRTSGSAS